jgi:DNA-binding NtrC family response regulator
MPSAKLEMLARSARERGRPYRILIVDDEPWIREVFHDFCNLTDAFNVEMAAGGAEAVEKVKRHDYDLVTLDLIMPEMSGLDALTEIKRAQPRVPVMVITGNATDKLVNRAGVLGACKVMYKPVQLETFITELTSALIR